MLLPDFFCETPKFRIIILQLQVKRGSNLPDVEFLNKVNSFEKNLFIHSMNMNI